jgi:Na+-transporting methylmalonyl-CoA/oxaloacetate decarboxylase beta subunit
MISATVHEIVSRSEFRIGLRWGCAAAGLGIAAGVISIIVFRRPAPVAGLLVTLAFVEAMKHFGTLPADLTRGLVYLSVAGLVAGVLAIWWRPLAFTGIVFAIPGAALLTSHTGLPRVSWVAPLVVMTVMFGGTLVADFDRRHRERGWSAVLYAVSVVGVYFTVPDTERALVLLGVSLPLLLLGWPVALVSLGTAGAYPAVGALAWIAAFEGLGRRTSIVGGVACLGLFVVEPLARFLKLGASTIFDALPQQAWTVFPVAAGHLGLVFVASRVAGLRTAVSQAAAIALIDLVIGLAVVLLLDSDANRVLPDRDRADL